MPTASDIRAWAKVSGYDPPERGNIPREIRTAYDAAHPEPNGSAGTSEPDYPDDGFGTLFVDPPPDDDRDDSPFDESAMAESAPRRPKAAKPKTGSGFSLPFGGGRKKPAGRAAKKKPRVSTEDVLGSVWRSLAKLATPLPPLQRTLRIQAPVAGMLLEDAVKDTAADVLLQPLARLSAQGKVVSALLGPPVIVTALAVHVQQRAQLDPPQDPNPLVVGVGIEALRSSLMTWMEVAGPKFEVALQREREFEGKYGKSVDDLIAFLLGPPAATPADVEAEENAIRRAQGIIVDS